MPVTVGGNWTLTLLDRPAESVRGKVCPAIVKPAPLTAAWEMVKLPEPALLKVTVCVLAVPTSTFPKSTLPGETLIWPVPGGASRRGITKPAHPAHPLNQKHPQTPST